MSVMSGGSLFIRYSAFSSKSFVSVNTISSGSSASFILVNGVPPDSKILYNEYLSNAIFTFEEAYRLPAAFSGITPQ